MDVVNAQAGKELHLFDDTFGRVQTHRVLVRHMFDAIFAACRATATGDHEAERSLHQRHAVLVQREQVVHRHGQIIQIGDEGPINVDDDFAALAPHQPLDIGHVQPLAVGRRRFGRGLPHRVGLGDHGVHPLGPHLLATFEHVDQLAEGQLRLAAEDEVERWEITHRLHGHGRDVGAKGHCLGAQGPGQHRSVHIVGQRRRCALGDVILGCLFAQDLFEFVPGHALGDGVHNVHRVIGLQHRCQLGQRALGPYHLFTATATDTVLRANPDAAIGRRWVDEHHVHCAGGATVGEVTYRRACVWECGVTQLRHPTCPKIFLQSQRHFFNISHEQSLPLPEPERRCCGG